MKRTRNLKVKKLSQLSPNMLRLTFTSKDLLDFPENEEGGYIKFLFTNKNEKNNEKLVRPYTIRNFRKKNLELDIDFAKHKSKSGYAAEWAFNAKIGDEIFISGPSSKQNINIDADWFLFVGDMSALPAISSHLEFLPRDSKGYAILEVLSNGDKINLKKPKNFEVYWVINDQSLGYSDKLYYETKKIDWYKGNPYVWVACEFKAMKKFREYFQIEKQINKKEMYISSYWKYGINQEEHKIIKKKDAIEWNG